MVVGLVSKKIKDRVIYVYPPFQQARRWKERAEKEGLTLSKFVMEHVENSIGQEEDSSYQSRAGLIARIRELEDVLSESSKENRMLRIVVEKLEKENRGLRVEQFTEEGFVGIRRYEEGLIDLLKRGQTISDDQILRELEIGPADAKLAKAVTEQLVNLESYGLIKRTPNGWRWVG